MLLWQSVAMRAGYLSTIDKRSFNKGTRMHQSVLCRYIRDSTTVFEVEASPDGVVHIGDSPVTLSWCKTCQPVNDWASIAACRSHPRRWWCTLTASAEELAKAKQICASCEVQQRCLALASPKDPLIHGGMDMHERAQAL